MSGGISRRPLEEVLIRPDIRPNSNLNPEKKNQRRAPERTLCRISWERIIETEILIKMFAEILRNFWRSPDKNSFESPRKSPERFPKKILEKWFKKLLEKSFEEHTDTFQPVHQGKNILIFFPGWILQGQSSALQRILQEFLKELLEFLRMSRFLHGKPKGSLQI